MKNEEIADALIKYSTIVGGNRIRMLSEKIRRYSIELSLLYDDGRLYEFVKECHKYKALERTKGSIESGKLNNHIEEVTGVIEELLNGIDIERILEGMLSRRKYMVNDSLNQNPKKLDNTLGQDPSFDDALRKYEDN